MKYLYILIISLSILPIHAMEKEGLEEEKEEVEERNETVRLGQQPQSLKKSKFSDEQLFRAGLGVASLYLYLSNATFDKPADDAGVNSIIEIDDDREETTSTWRTWLNKISRKIYSLYE